MACLNKKTKVTCIECGNDFISYDGNFHKSEVSKSGYRGQCKSCCNEYSRLHYQNNDHVRDRQKNYRDNVRSKRRKEGRYKETQLAYYDRSNELRREAYKFKRILRIVGKMQCQLNKYTSIDSSYFTEEQMLNNNMEILDSHKWFGSEYRECSLLDQNKKTV